MLSTGSLLRPALAVPQSETNGKTRHTIVNASPTTSEQQKKIRSLQPETISVTGIAISRFGPSRRQHEGAASTFISSGALESHHVSTVKGLQNLAPNLTVQPQGATANVNFSLRGVGLKDFTSNNTPSVMTYIDGVAYPIGFMAGNAIFDVSGVSVEPGPAGFTHGQTVTAGELNIQTNDTTSTLHAGVSQDIASYARSITSVYVSGPITQNLQYRIAGTTQHGGGYQSSRYDGAHLGDANKGALRGKLAWQPDNKTRIDLSGNWSQDNSDAMGVFNVEDLIVPYLAPDTNNLKTGWGFRNAFTKLIGVQQGTKPFLNDTVWGANLHMSRSFGWGELSSISAFEQMYIHNLMDLDSSKLATYDDYINNNSNMFSQEVKLKSKDEHSPFQWGIGVYYSRIRTKASFYNDFSDTTTRPYMSNTHYRQNEQTFSQFAQARYAITPKFRIIAGVSHESDDRQLLDLETVHYGFTDTHFGSRGALANQFSGKGGIEYQALKHLLIYGDIRKSFKPGGFTANNTVIAEQLTPTKPESLLAYEVGLKSDFWRNRIRINGNAFWYDYHGQQILGLDVVSGYGVVGQYVNIPKSTIWGAELEVDVNPISGLTLIQHLGYERGQYNNFNFLNSTAVYAYYAKTGIYSPFYTSFKGVDSGIPKLTLNGSVSYRLFPLPDWSLTPSVDYSYRGSQLDMPGSPVYRMPAYFLLNASMTLAPRHGIWSATVYATNLLDRHYDLTRDIGTNSFYGIPGAPRFIGGRIKIDY
ncbi:TonB-dependent receptor [Gluconobacter japonicus]|nr:TonB-dependent receptor [Gluconobacter japonicus]